MTSQNFKMLGKDETIRARRFKVLQLYLRNATPPETAFALGIDLRQVYRDIEFLRNTQLNDLPLEIIRDMGTNFFEMQVRELDSKAASLKTDCKDDRRFFVDLKNLIMKNKIESLKMQGAYEDGETKPPGPIQIIFKEVDGTYGANIPERPSEPKAEEEAGGQDDEQEEGED